MTEQEAFIADRDDNEKLHRTRAGRTLRNCKYRRAVEDQRQSKRLFTPEIKRFLKSWLVRRRKNPYPNRSEKKDLALKTGLTYVQVCNWFANWRRKLKKSSRERQRCTWGHLIKDYNTKAQGNVEQFSISSDDSIWDENVVNINDFSDVEQLNDQNTDISSIDHCYFSFHNGEDHRFELTNECNELVKKDIPRMKMWDGLDKNANKLNKKCVRGSFRSDVYTKDNVSKFRRQKKTESPLLLSKWLESAAKFVPRDSFIAWTNVQGRASWQDNSKTKQRANAVSIGRHREELDAAEALTSLSRQNWVTTAP